MTQYDDLKNFIGKQILLFHSKKVIYSSMLECYCFNPKNLLHLKYMDLLEPDIRGSINLKFRIPKDSEKADIHFFSVSSIFEEDGEGSQSEHFEYYFSNIFIVKDIKILTRSIKLSPSNYNVRKEFRGLLFNSTANEMFLVEPDSICEAFEPVKIIFDKDEIESIINLNYNYHDDEIIYSFESLEYS